MQKTFFWRRDGTLSRRELDVLAQYGVTRMEELPRFMQFGFELLRKNQTQWYSRNPHLGFDVAAAVGAVAKSAEDTASISPRLEFEYFIKRAARRRLSDTDTLVWPEAAGLVEKDIVTIMQNLAREQKTASAHVQAEAAESEPKLPPVPAAWAPLVADFVPKSLPPNLYETPTLSNGAQITWQLWQEPTHFDGLDIRSIADSSAVDVLYPNPLEGLEHEELVQLRREAEQILKDLEDKIVRAMRMQHVEDVGEAAPTHQELDYEVYKEKQVLQGSALLTFDDTYATASPTLSQGASDVTRDLMEAYIGSLDAWDVARVATEKERVRLFGLLEPIIMRTDAVDKVYNSNGVGRLVLRKAMMLDMGLSTDLRVFESWAVPLFDKKKAILFSDISDSMNGFKGDESFKAIVTAADVLDLLGFDLVIGVFGDEANVIKDWEDDLESKRTSLSEAIKPIRTGTGTHKAAKIAVDKATDDTSFVLFVTDGHPNGDGKAELILHTEALHARGIPTIGICIGDESDEIRDYFAYSVKVPTFDGDSNQPSPFVGEMADAVEVAIRNNTVLVREGAVVA